MALPFTNIVHAGKALAFDLVGVDVAVANALRRTILADIKTVAVAYDSAKDAPTDITFLKNTSSLHNEYLSRRIALLPFNLSRSQVQQYVHGALQFKLHVKNTGADMLDVTTHDVELVHSADPSILSVRDVFPTPILITRLKPNPLDPQRGEEINLEFGARHGTAKQHARWAAVSLCTYRNRLDQARVAAARAELQSKCSNADMRSDADMNKFETLDRWRLFEINQHGEPCAFSFQIESECGLCPVDIVDLGFDALIARVRQLRDDVDTKLKAERDDATGMHMVMVHNEDHTLGNLLQAFCHNTYVRTDQPRLQYVGYFQPHPLLPDVVIKLKGVGDASFDAIAFVCEAAAALEAHLLCLKDVWNEATAKGAMPPQP